MRRFLRKYMKNIAFSRVFLWLFGGLRAILAIIRAGFLCQRHWQHWPMTGAGLNFLQNQLFDVLTLMENNRIPLAKLKGSWAGAMGDVQFMPSTFVKHATDGDGDGQYDLWDSLPDIMFSAANYLANIGWNGEETWGREVSLPKNFDLELIGGQTKLPITQWAARGVRKANGTALPTADIDGAIILPAGITGPAFLVYNNYEKILIWNRSELCVWRLDYLRISWSEGQHWSQKPQNLHKRFCEPIFKKCNRN